MAEPFQLHAHQSVPGAALTDGLDSESAVSDAAESESSESDAAESAVEESDIPNTSDDEEDVVDSEFEAFEALEEEEDAVGFKLDDNQQARFFSQRASLAWRAKCVRMPDDTLKSIKSGWFPNGDEVQTAAYAGFHDVEDARRWFLMPCIFEVWVIFFKMGAPTNKVMWPRMHHDLKRFVDEKLPDFKDDKKRLDCLIKTNLKEKIALLEYTTPDKLPSGLEGTVAEQKAHQADVLPWLLCFLVHKVGTFWSLSSNDRQVAYDRHVTRMKKRYQLTLPALDIAKLELSKGPQWSYPGDVSTFESYNGAFCFLRYWNRGATMGKRNKIYTRFPEVFSEGSLTTASKDAIEEDIIPLWQRVDGREVTLKEVMAVIPPLPSKEAPREIKVMWDRKRNIAQVACRVETGTAAMSADEVLGDKLDEAIRTFRRDPRDEWNEATWRDCLRFWLELPREELLLETLCIMDNAVTGGDPDHIDCHDLWHRKTGSTEFTWPKVQAFVKTSSMPTFVYTVAFHDEGDDLGQYQYMESSELCSSSLRMHLKMCSDGLIRRIDEEDPGVPQTADNSSDPSDQSGKKARTADANEPMSLVGTMSRGKRVAMAQSLTDHSEDDGTRKTKRQKLQSSWAESSLEDESMRSPKTQTLLKTSRRKKASSADHTQMSGTGPTSDEDYEPSTKKRTKGTGSRGRGRARARGSGGGKGTIGSEVSEKI
ncbi:hypothetical protein LTR86_008133 [Recurvomyces mirabilis]|nr:hypothetical protein LTR86_008133 [Recurvomyces mirabilis]